MTFAFAHPQAVSHQAHAPATRRTLPIVGAYLVASACLAPVCVPEGPGQTALLDFLNLGALGVASLKVLAPGQRLRLPMMLPMLLVALGSLLAMFSAPSLVLAGLALAQDVYLFAWFLLVVNLVRDAGSLRTLQVAWMWTAVAISLGAVGQVLAHGGGSLAGLFGSRGLRPSSTLYNPNMLADYLVITMFITASASASLPRLVRWGVYGVLALGLITTKSNGGMIALVTGLVVWTLVRAATRGASLQRWLAGIALAASLGGLGVWMHVEWGVGDSLLASLKQHTFAGRMEHSSESRLRIWDQLERTYAHSPLGIGPGNSGAIALGIAERERPGSYMSKEAHSDYLAYAIERGPLGVLGLLLMTAAGFIFVARYWGHAGVPARRTRGAGVWTAGMAAALAASAVHSTVIEKLHFRHFWLLLAMVCGSMYMAAQQAADAEAAAPEAERGAELPIPSGARARQALGAGADIVRREARS
jgi:hypothetical protein